MCFIISVFKKLLFIMFSKYENVDDCATLALKTSKEVDKKWFNYANWFLPTKLQLQCFYAK